MPINRQPSLFLLLLLSVLTMGSFAIHQSEVKVDKPLTKQQVCLNELYSLNLPSADCIRPLIDYGAGQFCMTLSLVVKVPQIMKILFTRSAEGVSQQGNFFEMLTYLINIIYNLHFNNPFSGYGEDLFKYGQGLVLFLLLPAFSKESYNKAFFIMLAMMVGMLGSFYLGLIPEAFYEFSLIVNMILFTTGKLPQILKLHQMKKLGQLSFPSVWITFWTAFARGISSPPASFSLLLMLNRYLKVALNGILYLQCIYYMRTAKKTVNVAVRPTAKPAAKPKAK